jgi:hypothetical protein
LEPAFTPGTGAAPLTRWSTGLCRGDEANGGAEGPDLLLVDAELDGVPLVLAVDTGADFTLVRQRAIPDLASRPTLSGLPLRTAFAGAFPATATRARALSAGGQSSAAAPVLVAPEIDRGLDLLLQRFRDPPLRLDGALGWSFLREPRSPWRWARRPLPRARPHPLRHPTTGRATVGGHRHHLEPGAGALR